MSFNQMLAQAATQNSVDILPGWGQGRVTFGGVIAAVMLENLLAMVGTDLALRSLTVSFLDAGIIA